jgi:hypothetical protein
MFRDRILIDSKFGISFYDDNLLFNDPKGSIFNVIFLKDALIFNVISHL